MFDRKKLEFKSKLSSEEFLKLYRWSQQLPEILDNSNIYFKTIPDNKISLKQAEKYELTQQQIDTLRTLWNNGNKIPLKQARKLLKEIDKQKFNRQNEQLSEPDFNCFQKKVQCKSFDFSTDAKKLPQGIRGFLKDEELQAYCIERRQAWYKDRSLNFRTHLIVWLKTWYFVITEFICKKSIANIRHRFQPLHQPRLPRN